MYGTCAHCRSYCDLESDNGAIRGAIGGLTAVVTGGLKAFRWVTNNTPEGSDYRCPQCGELNAKCPQCDELSIHQGFYNRCKACGIEFLSGN